MAPADFTLPSDMTLTGALAICLVIVVAVGAITAATLIVGRAFSLLSPARRADLVRFVRALRRG